MEKFPADISEIVAAIGQVTIDWNHMEDGFFQLLPHLLGDVDREAYELLRNELKLRDALLISKNIAIAKPKLHCRDHVINLCTKVDNVLRPFRNRLIHDPIYTYKPGAFSRTTYATRVNKSASREEKSIKWEHQSPISKLELTAFSFAINSAESYTGAIIDNIAEGAFTSKPPEEAVFATQDRFIDFDLAIDSYTKLTRSVSNN